jgi:hypothetical protein
MAADVEQIVCRRVHGQEPLRGACGFESLTLALSSSNRHMRTFNPVIGPLVHHMANVQPYVAECSTIRLSRLEVRRTSRTSPSSSIARHKHICRPRTETNISSRCHFDVDLDLVARIRPAICGPNRSTQQRIVSYVTSIPRSARISSTSRRLKCEPQKRDDESVGRTYRSRPKYWLDIAAR